MQDRRCEEEAGIKIPLHQSNNPSRAEECFYKCYFSKLNFMDEIGNLNVPGYVKYLSSEGLVFPNAIEIAWRCNMYNRQQDLCKKAYFFSKCVFEEGIKAIISLP